MKQLSKLGEATGTNTSERPATITEESYRALFELTPAMLHSIDETGRLRSVSNRWLDTLGYSREEVIGRLLVDFLTPESRRRATEVGIPTLFRSGRIDDFQYQAICRDGRVIDVLLSAVIPPSSWGAGPLSLTVAQDITAQAQERRLFFEQYERLRITLESIGDGIITTDADGRVEYLNPVAEQLTGWKTHAAKGRPIEVIFKVLECVSGLSLRSSVRQCLHDGAAKSLTDKAVLISRDCKEYYVQDSAAPIRTAGGELLGAVLAFRDVSEQHRLNGEMVYRATHDSLTGVTNRNEFSRRLALLATEAVESNMQHALIFLDLDRFKLVNDAVGHAAGDELLKQVTQIIRRTVRAIDLVARLGGDEFAVILSRCGLESARNVAQKLCDEIDRFRFRHGSQHFHIGASIGLVPIDGNWSTSEGILQAADDACFTAKQEGRNRVHTYRPTDGRIAAYRQDMHWVRRLEQALDGDQFALYWQQYTSLHDADRRVHGEILLRMIEDGGRIVPPGAFLPAAERFHIASRIDRWVVNKVTQWMRENRERLAHVATLSINLSGLSVGDPDFQRYVTTLLHSSEFDHHKICFEITETAAITNLAGASSFILDLRQFGVRFALDDFGSGAASFGYLRNLPVDYVKIDGQFTRDLENDGVNQATIRCILDIARLTGKQTVAEFVETEQTETLLREIGVDYSQGYLRHRPAPMDEILTAACRS